MIIQIQKFKYEIQELQLAEKMVETLYNDYQTSFPGFTEIIKSWDSNYMKEMITSLINKIPIFLENVNIENAEIPKNTDEDTNLEWLLRRKISENENSVIELPDFIATNEKAIDVYYRFILRSLTEIIKLIGFSSNYPIDVFNALSDDPDLLYTKKIKDNLNKHYPVYKRDYDPAPFNFLRDYVKLLNPPGLSKSILIRNKNKIEFEKFIDIVFSEKYIINDEQKKHFKTWFHYKSDIPKDVEPIYFEDNEDTAFYLAYFIKTIGGGLNSKFQIISRVEKINEWLNTNLIVKTNHGLLADFSQLNKYLKEFYRSEKRDSILKNIIEFA